MARPDTASDGALPFLKTVSPSTTPNSERTILTDSCLKHMNYACANRVSAFSRNRLVNCRLNTPGKGCFRYSSREHNSASPGNKAETTHAVNHVGVSTQPAQQTPSAPSRATSAALPTMKNRPTFTGYTSPSTRQQSALQVQLTSTI